jgi:hypothetical protein
MIGQWRLVHTPHQNKGEKDAISIMRAGDLSDSDLDFVGLMVRSADVDADELIVLLHLLSPRARPRISVNGTPFEARFVPPG